MTKERLLQCQGQLKRIQDQLADEQRRQLAAVDPSLDASGWQALLSQLGMDSTGSSTSAEDVVRYVAQMQQELAVLRHGHRTLTKEGQHLASTCAALQAQQTEAVTHITSLKEELEDTQRQVQRHLNHTAFLKQELESVRSVGQAYEQQAKCFAKDPAPLLEAKVQGLEAQLTHVQARNGVLEQELQLQAKGGSTDVTSARYMDYDPRTTKVVRDSAWIPV